MNQVANQASRKSQNAGLISSCQAVDIPLVLASFALLCLGLVMLASASMDIAGRNYGDSFYLFKRQFLYAVLGLIIAVIVYWIPLCFWQKIGWLWLFAAFVLLITVLVPGIGHTVNGSTRWIILGSTSVQVSEFVKLLIALYLAGYLVRHTDSVRQTWSGLLRPLLLIALISLLLLAEPDFGAMLVLVAISLSMLFVSGVRTGPFILSFLLAGSLAIFLIFSSPYRLARLTTFMNPWADPFDSGFQLTQALIAIGSGSWFGVGLGNSVQKLFYLPEAHNDFLFAVLAEELGLIGVLVVILLFVFILWRCYSIARCALLAGQFYAAYLAYGFGTWIGLQAFINMGVNMGLLPTKGLTLPLMSAGGSSMLAILIILGLMQRIYLELNRQSSSSQIIYPVSRPAQHQFIIGRTE